MSRRAGRRIVAFACVAPLFAAACADAPTGSDPADDSLLARALAAGLAPMPTEPVRPVENPYDSARVALGHLLFFDPILSGPRDVACSTCHLPRFAFADGRQFPSGAGATGLGPSRTDPEPPPLRLMPRNSPTVFNVGLFGRMSSEPSVNGAMFWGGNAFGLEDQVLNPISADNELRGLTYAKAVALDSVLARLRAIPEYVDRFADAYPAVVDVYGRDPAMLIHRTTLRRAIAAYLRELVTPNAPIDAFLRGDADALTAQQKAGLELFIGKANCVACHRGPNLSDFDFHVLGVLQEGLGRDTTPEDDLGWGEHGGTRYAFRTAPLRQVALTAPYFHAGTAESLEEVIRFKNVARSEHEKVAPEDLAPEFRPLGLTDAEIADLVAFLHALTDTITIKEPLFLAPARVPSGLPIPK
ncbi:MAG TPA: cytochrome c peroxidase [Longimicrobiales bacterium]